MPDDKKSSLDNELAKRRVAEILNGKLVADYEKSVYLPDFEVQGQSPGIFISHPPAFRPDTPVLGSPDLARAVWDIEKIAPDLRGNIPRVYGGPNESVLFHLTGTKFQPQDYPRLNILGVTNRNPRDRARYNEISINPRLAREAPDELYATVGHEMFHTVGGDHDAKMSTLEDLLRGLYNRGAFTRK